MMNCQSRCSVNLFRLVLLGILLMAVPAGAVSRLRPYEKIPAFDLPGIDPKGQHVTAESLRGKTSILVFGELYNTRTLEALKELEQLRQKMRANNIDRAAWNVLLIVAQNITAEQLRQEQVGKDVKATIVQDRNRAVFGAYGVVVLPSFVVVDPQGKISTTISGYPLTFSDMITDAILFSQGKLTRQQLETASRPSVSALKTDQDLLKAERLASLARQLFRRGYTELALERFEQILELDGGYLPARIGIARCLIKLRRLAEAENALQEVLQKDQKNPDAGRTMARIEIMRGGDELSSARKRLDLILALHHHDPEAHYLKGLICEAEGKTEEAKNEYKAVAETLLEL